MTDTTTQTAADTATTTEAAAKPKVKRIRRPSQTATPAGAATVRKGKAKPADQQHEAPAAKTEKPAKAATPKAEKPSRPLYAFDTTGQGNSTALNARVSRTAIDHTRFGTGKDWALSERDQRSMEMLRREFGGKTFKRENLDAGILRRLGERGCIEYVSGTHADSLYKLTRKGLGQPEAKAKRAANG